MVILMAEVILSTLLGHFIGKVTQKIVQRSETGLFPVKKPTLRRFYAKSSPIWNETLPLHQPKRENKSSAAGTSSSNRAAVRG